MVTAKQGLDPSISIIRAHTQSASSRAVSMLCSSVARADSMKAGAR
ncbi:hypothetical protein [Dictyobacter vulcani]|nr:hypothetical protein [Dictyobacter vulcani]